MRVGESEIDETRRMKSSGGTFTARWSNGQNALVEYRPERKSQFVECVETFNSSYTIWNVTVG